MGGESKSSQTQQSISQPWQPAVPYLQGMLGQIGTGLGNTGITSAENQVLGTLQNNASDYTNQFAPQINANATELLNGGGDALKQTAKNYYDQTNPLASNLNYDPMQNPGTAALLSRITGDITNQVNGSFAAGGRDFSGANQGALGRGIAEGVAPTLFNQYNANRSAQQGAANSSAALLSGLQQQQLANKQVGTGAATQALDAQNMGANATLQAEAARRGIPVQALGLLAQIGIPIAGLGGQTNSTGTATQQDSLAKQFGQIGSGFGGIFGNFGVGKAFPKIF